MLENSFLHLPSVGLETESRLWLQGIKTWSQLAENLRNVFGVKRAERLFAEIEKCRAAKQNHDFTYFTRAFPASEAWRVLPTLIAENLTESIAFIDIETTGLGFPPQCQSTTIAVLFQGELQTAHLPSKKREILQRVEAEAKLLVTFNGASFDLPFLRREFGFKFAQAHLDLRFWLARLERRGGLKKIQASFAEIKQREYMDIDGFDAVKLWRMHERGVPRALETLLTYNAEDTVVLESLIYCGLNLEVERLRAWQLPLEPFLLPMIKPIPTQVCARVYQTLRGGHIPETQTQRSVQKEMQLS